MVTARVLIVAETPSLARSVSYLLESAGITTDTVSSLAPTDAGSRLGGGPRHQLIIVASNAPVCWTARRWIQGEFPGTELLVVGSRDPTVLSASQIRHIELPLRPAALLDLVRERLPALASREFDISDPAGKGLALDMR